MEGISDIRIIGIDEKRPPTIRKEPYVDVYFKLSHKAPADWCRDFNAMLSRLPNTPKIKDSEGLFIEVWVRSPDEIVVLLDMLKKKIVECSRIYVERIELATRSSGDANDLMAQQQAGEQGRLNRIIAGLVFED